MTTPTLKVLHASLAQHAFPTSVPDTLAPGDLLAFTHAGAYGATMSSTYNSRDLIPEVLVEGARFRVIRARTGIAAALRQETPGAWQSSGEGSRSV